MLTYNHRCLAWGGLTRERGYRSGIHTECELQHDVAGRVSARGGGFGKDPDGGRRRRRHGRRGRHRSDEPGQDRPRHYRQRPRLGARPERGPGGRGSAAGQGRQRLRQDVPDAPRGQDRGPLQAPDPYPRRPLDGLHARRRPRLPGDSQRPRAGLQPDHQAQHRRGRLRRHRRARAWGHRAAGGDAGHGGQGRALQAVRQRGRVPDLPRHQGHRRDRRDRQEPGARLRRDQPGGHLRPAVLRDRRAPQERSSTSPSSTTTSTARRSW